MLQVINFGICDMYIEPAPPNITTNLHHMVFFCPLKVSSEKDLCVTPTPRSYLIRPSGSKSKHI